MFEIPTKLFLDDSTKLFLNLYSSKIFYVDTDLKIILLDYQNNYVGNLSNKQYCKKVLTFQANFSVLHKYFDNPIKLFTDLYLAKFLDTSAKLLFPCKVAFR